MIPGLRYVSSYLDATTHDELLAAADTGPWRQAGDRRMQIYGYSYDLRKGGAYRVEDLPPWAQQLAIRLERDGLMRDVADQLIVNEYSAGQGIPPHVDAPLHRHDRVDQSRVELRDGVHESELGKQFLEPRSALVIAGEARHKWKHAIPARTADQWQGREKPRTRRISLTFRKVLPPEQRPAWEPASWANVRNRWRVPMSNE
jgi:alkylated DNA repair dioxygenase AlkB